MFARRFPPCNCWPTASERAFGLVCGLSELGWTPVVITSQVGSPGCTCGSGDSTESGRDLGVELIRVNLHGRGSGLLGRSLQFITGKTDDWTSQARRAAQRYLSKAHVDLVWTTAAPVSTLRLGRLLRRTRSVPWVAELRDGIWRTSVMLVKGRGPKAWLLRRRALLLARPLRDADAVVHVWPQDARADARLIRQASNVIPSAFDESAWARIHASERRREHEASVLTVMFAGAVYRGRSGYKVFFDGARKYAAGPAGRSRPIRVRYMGPSFDRFRAEAQMSGMSEALIDGGIVSLARSREAMREADALLLVTTSDGLAGSPGGKLYEYLAASKPIIAVPGTDEYAADVLRRTGRGVGAADPDAVCTALVELAAGSLAVPPWPSADLEEFTWGARSRLVADVFERCLALSTKEPA
jgi:glycosyltransferase involved in cell wall biosynthesis